MINGEYPTPRLGCGVGLFLVAIAEADWPAEDAWEPLTSFDHADARAR